MTQQGYQYQKNRNVNHNNYKQSFVNPVFSKKQEATQHFFMKYANPNFGQQNQYYHNKTNQNLTEQQFNKYQQQHHRVQQINPLRKSQSNQDFFNRYSRSPQHDQIHKNLSPQPIPVKSPRGSKIQETIPFDKKYNNYPTIQRTKKQQYKYNLFSMLDQPWNRCCEVGKCGSFPGNQCLAKDQKTQWQ